MTEQSANLKHKNSLFTKLFSDPNSILQLYNAISQSNYPPETKIEITTLENVLLNGIYNDLSFIIDGKLVVLIEHQSTINPNMPLRLMFYLSEIYDGLIDRKSAYSSKLIKIPRPEFIVLYNGKEDFPDEKELRLSEAFIALPDGHKPNGDLELSVRVLNINKGRNETIIQGSVELSGYIAIVDAVRGNINSGLTLNEAVKKAIKDCANMNILPDFLEKHGGDVMSMLHADWNIDDFGEVKWEEGLEEGLLRGIKGMLKLGNPPEKIAECMNLPLDKVLALRP